MGGDPRGDGGATCKIAAIANEGQGMPSRCILSFSHAGPTCSSASMRRSDQPCSTRRTRKYSSTLANPSSARRACRLPAQHAVCRAIARWGRMVARWRGCRCWSSRSRTVAGWTPSSLAMLVVGHRRVIARSARYVCSDGKPSSRARAARCWSVQVRRRRAAVTWRGDGVMSAMSSRWRTTVVVVASSLASCAGLACCWQRAWR